jgi:hypothetical protein
MIHLMLGEVADAGMLAHHALAGSIGSSPTSVLISVDLPAPLGPSRPMRDSGLRFSRTLVRIFLSP